MKVYGHRLLVREITLATLVILTACKSKSKETLSSEGAQKTQVANFQALKESHDKAKIKLMGLRDQPLKLTDVDNPISNQLDIAVGSIEPIGLVLDTLIANSSATSESLRLNGGDGSANADASAVQEQVNSILISEVCSTMKYTGEGLGIYANLLQKSASTEEEKALGRELEKVSGEIQQNSTVGICLEANRSESGILTLLPKGQAGSSALRLNDNLEPSPETGGLDSEKVRIFRNATADLINILSKENLSNLAFVKELQAMDRILSKEQGLTPEDLMLSCRAFSMIRLPLYSLLNSEVMHEKALNLLNSVYCQ